MPDLAFSVAGLWNLDRLAPSAVSKVPVTTAPAARQVSLVTPSRGPKVSALDLTLVINLITSTASLRNAEVRGARTPCNSVLPVPTAAASHSGDGLWTTAVFAERITRRKVPLPSWSPVAEVWTPVCLPHYAGGAFAYAYIQSAPGFQEQRCRANKASSLRKPGVSSLYVFRCWRVQVQWFKPGAIAEWESSVVAEEAATLARQAVWRTPARAGSSTARTAPGSPCRRCRPSSPQSPLRTGPRRS